MMPLLTEAFAALIGCGDDEVIFTSGGSEANNLALKGIFSRSRFDTPHVITTPAEHASVVETCRFLAAQGARVSYVPVDRTGLVNPDDVHKEIRPETALISVMHSNNEIGTIQPIADIGRIARHHGIGARGLLSFLYQDRMVGARAVERRPRDDR